MTGTGNAGKTVKTWQTVELHFQAQHTYENPYAEVELWVQLTGPDFDQRVWGFWDGGGTFKVRVVATGPGHWSWTSHANVDDAGLAGHSGSFTAVARTEAEKQRNPNLRGLVRTNPDAPHAFMYADGTPFYLFADTWWAAMTWRYPFKGGIEIEESYLPAEHNWSLEGGVFWLKKHGYNSIAMIASFPSWKVDREGPEVQDDRGIYIRMADSWGKGPVGKHVKDMHDQDGNMPFEFPGICAGKTDICANLDRINPAYWQSFDQKIDYLWQNGMVPYLETVRRDQLAVWVHYHNFNASFARYINYLKARYGTYNLVFSLVHWDFHQPEVRIDHLRGAFAFYHLKYGGMPFGQPVTAMVVESSSDYLGHTDVAPYLTCHSAGNANRGHGILGNIESFYHLEPKVPGFNNEPYYPVHDVPWNRPGGEKIVPDSERDNYFARTHMYSNFFSGALGGHVFGTGAFGGCSVGEEPYVGKPAPWPKIWEALTVSSLKQGKHFKEFVDGLDGAHGDLIVAYQDLSHPRNDSDVLDEWSYMLKSPDQETVLLYFERRAHRQVVSNLPARKPYSAQWFNPRTGEWTQMGDSTLETDGEGTLELPVFPSGELRAQDDWAAKLTGLA